MKWVSMEEIYDWWPEEDTDVPDWAHQPGNGIYLAIPDEEWSVFSALVAQVRAMQREFETRAWRKI